IVDDLATARRVVEEARLEGHLLGVESDPLVGPGVIVMTADRVLMSPREDELEVMAGYALVDDDRPGVAGRREAEIAELRRREPDVADPVLVQSSRRGVVDGHAQSGQGREVGRQRQVAVMLHPLRNGEQSLRLEKRADRQLVAALAIDLGGLVGEDRELRQA